MNHAHSLVYGKEMAGSRKLTAIIGVAFFILATALAGYVRIPVHGSPVPITLQTFFVILAGAVLGRKLGFCSQIGYVLLGAAGLPIFQGASFGAACLLGPTGGYLIGFMICALVVGSIINYAGSNIISIAVVFALGSLIIDVSGTIWLIYAHRMPPVSAFAAGTLPFILGDMAKAAAASIIYLKISKRSKQIFSI